MQRRQRLHLTVWTEDGLNRGLQRLFKRCSCSANSSLACVEVRIHSVFPLNVTTSGSSVDTGCAGRCWVELMLTLAELRPRHLMTETVFVESLFLREINYLVIELVPFRGESISCRNLPCSSTPTFLNPHFNCLVWQIMQWCSACSRWPV